MKKQLQKQLCIFAAFAAAFLAAGSIWYWQTGGTLALTVLMFTPTVSVLLTTLLAGAGWKELLASFHLKPRLRQNKGRYLGVWLLTPVVAYLGAAFYFLLFPQQFTLQSALAVESGMQGTDYIAFLATMIPLAVLVNPLMGLPQCLGEELAWRGWLLPKLTERFGQLRAVLLTGPCLGNLARAGGGDGLQLRGRASACQRRRDGAVLSGAGCDSGISVLEDRFDLGTGALSRGGQWNRSVEADRPLYEQPGQPLCGAKPGGHRRRIGICSAGNLVPAADWEG